MAKPSLASWSVNLISPKWNLFFSHHWNVLMDGFKILSISHLEFLTQEIILTLKQQQVCKSLHSNDKAGSSCATAPGPVADAQRDSPLVLGSAAPGENDTRSFPSSGLLWVSPPSKLSTNPHLHSSVEFQFCNSCLATEPPNSTWTKPGQPWGEYKLTRVFTQAPIPSRSWSNLVLTKPKCANTKTKTRVSPCATPRRSGKPPITIRKGYLPLSVTIAFGATGSSETSRSEFVLHAEVQSGFCLP